MAKRCIAYLVTLDPILEELDRALDSGDLSPELADTAHRFLMDPESFIQTDAIEYDGALPAAAASHFGLGS